jgi:hypothetical protein
MSKLRAVEVNRDECGYWCHPDILHFWTVTMDNAEYCTPEQWKALEQEAGIQTTFTRLEYEDMEHPAYVSYFDNDDGNVSGWNPEVPDGWWLLEISDGDDGPYAVFATEAT